MRVVSLRFAPPAVAVPRGTGKGFDVKTEFKTMAQAKAAFLDELPEDIRRLYRRGKPQNGQCCDLRCAWVDWVNASVRSGRMTERMGQTITL